MTLFNYIQPTIIARRHYRRVQLSLLVVGNQVARLPRIYWLPAVLSIYARVKLDVLLAAIEDETYWSGGLT